MIAARRANAENGINVAESGMKSEAKFDRREW